MSVDFTTTRPTHYILDKDGNPQPESNFLTWARWYQRHNRRVGKVILPINRRVRIVVSTVFLSLDHGFHFLNDNGTDVRTTPYRPVLWETMVFYQHYPLRKRGLSDPQNRDFDGVLQRRYRSGAEAKADFKQLVTFLTSMKAQWGRPPTYEEVAGWCEAYDTLDEEDEEQAHCRTPGCTDDPNDGEGWDGFCGNCADRLEADEEVSDDE